MAFESKSVPVVGRLVLVALALLAGLVSSLALPSPDERLAPGPVTVRVSQENPGGAAIAGAVVHVGGRVAPTASDGRAVLDGVPAGSYELVVERHGFDRHESRILLQRGAREPFDVTLVPSVVVPLTGIVTAGEAWPVAGARLELEAESTLAGCDTRVVFHTGWDGQFEVLELPLGEYTARVSAAGCEERTLRVELGPEPTPLDIALEIIRSETAFAVAVRDSVSDEPIAGASVTIAEAWPAGTLAEGTTGGDGRASWSSIALARLNWRDAEGLLAAGSGRATLHVAAEGYEPVALPVPQRLGGTTAVALHPTAAIREAEPNNDLASAQPIRTGAPVELTIPENGDHDHFRFHLDDPARVRLALGPELPLWCRLYLLAADGKRLAGTRANVGQEAVIEADLSRGDYLVLVHQFYDNTSSKEPFTLFVERRVAADPFEPNDSPATARRLRPGEEARGFVFPLGDRDCYRFELERPGHVQLTIPPVALWRVVELADKNGTAIKNASAHPEEPLTLLQQLAAGQYTVTVRQYYDNRTSLEPYTLRLETILDDGVDDPAETPGTPLRAIRPLELGHRVGSTIFPTGDVDRFALALPEPGVLHARIRSPFWCRLKARSRTGELLASNSAHPGEPFEISWHCRDAQGVVLEIRQYYDNRDSNLPYLLSTWWEPADEIDVLAHNETIEEAFPAFVGEPLRGSLLPVGDHDVFRLEVDHPGLLRLDGSSPVWSRFLVRDEEGTVVRQDSRNADVPLSLATPVLPGVYFVEVHQYYDNTASILPYALSTRLERAAPAETVPLAEAPPRAIALGEIVPFAIEQKADRDRFTFFVPREGPFFLRLRPSVWTKWELFDEASGQRVRKNSVDADQEQVWELAAAGPTRYRLELHQYYDNQSAMAAGWFTVGEVDRPLAGGRLEVQVDPADPTTATFTFRAQEGVAPPARAMLDADGNGTDDVALPLGQPVTHRYGAPGVFAARVNFTSADGSPGSTHAWVDAVGVRPREGVQVVVQHPAEGATIERNEPCRVRAISYTGARVGRVEFALDGRVVATAFTEPYEAELPWSTLGTGEHALTVSAFDGHGDRGVVERHVRVSEYFELLPENGAVITGDGVTVRWTGPGFGRAGVRYRLEGETEWQVREGERARERRVVLTDLEPEKTYELQPLGDGEPGPIHRVTRVRGLAFGKDRYATQIERDYDQRLGISVRNHGDDPLRVVLTSGEPSEESRLLVSFIGEGSEEAPIELGPGEERDFLLAMSAQDVNVPRVSFPVQITSDAGYADEAEVTVDVRLPEVKLRWEELAATDHALLRSYLLHNDGDGLTDLFLRSSSPDILVTPELEHGIFPAGDTLRVQARPRLYEGFQEVEGSIAVGAVGQEESLDVALQLPEGMSIFGVQLVAGAGALDEEASWEENLLAARSMAGAYLNPNVVDWSQRSDPVDSDEDGRVDRWSIDDELEGILWVGDDTTGDGEIDFVHADIGSDGQYDYSAYRTADGWQQTNLVEAYLEMGFALPRARTSYKRHDLDLVMNGLVVGSLRDVIPEGNYTFRLPPAAIRFNEAGEPEGNDVQIKSKHLNGGHYVVSSDFRIKARMTGTRIWTVAESEDAARRSVLDTEGLSVDGPDYSISSAELLMTGKLVRGKELLFAAPVRNVGATRTKAVGAALMKDVGHGSLIELARTYVEDVPLCGNVTLRIPWTAAAGAHTLWVVLDPDGETGDTNEGNDRAAITFEIAGDEGPPTIAILEPVEGAKLSDTVLPIVVEAADDDVVLGVEVSVDGGLAAPLSPLPEPGRYAGQVLLQPGRHTITATARDGSNQRAQQAVEVTVDVPLPIVELVSPADDAEIDERRVTVRLRAGEEAKVVAARANGGPWKPGRLTGGGESEIELDLSFGSVTLEVMATDARGARATARVRVRCTAQAEEEEEEDPAEEPGGEKPPDEPPSTIDVDGVGEIDAFGPPSAPIAPAGGSGRAPAAGGGQRGPAPPTGNGPANTPPPERPRVGSAPATEAQPPTLPPARELPPLEEDDPDGGNEPEEEPATEGEPLEPGEVRGGPPLPTPPGQRPPASRPRGGFIGARARQKDWYCTNRPEIKVKFRLPDWLKNKKLPKPGTPEFKSMMVRLITDMQMRGYKTGRLEQFQKALLRRIEGMNQPGELPGFLESFNIGGPKPEDPKALAEWREKMGNSAQAWFLRLLASGDPSLVAQGLKVRGEAIGQFDKAMLEHAQGAVTEIEANQKLVEDCAEALPVVGEMSDIYAFATGETALAGQRVSALERAIRLAGVIGPFGLEQLIKRSPNARLVLQALGEMGESAGQAGRRMLAGALDLPPGKVDDGLAAIGNWLTKERRLIGETMEDKMAREARLFAKSPAGIADGTRRLKDHADARDLVSKLRKSAPDSDEFQRAVRELQSNKTAQALINKADVPDVLRKDVNQHIKTWYDAADEGVAEGFEGLYRHGKPSADDTRRIAGELGITPRQAEDFQQQVEEFARKHGVDPSEVKVDKLTITNRRPPKPGEVPRTSVGRDRDVTFQMQAPMKDPKTGKILVDPDSGLPRMVGEDLDHAVSKNAYDRKFYSASGEGELPRLPDGSIDQAKISRYAEDTMDQTVTSAGHVEAYNTGPVQLDDFLDKGITPTLTRVDDICDTVSYKSDHWFRKAGDAADAGDLVMASRHTAEGMRQATKQYDDLVLSRVRQYGLDPRVHVPPRLQTSMDIFRQVKEGAISPAKAEAMLKSIGTSTEGAVRDMSGFLNGLEKTTGVGWRRVKSAELVNQLADLQKKGGRSWQDDAYGAINNALKKGEVSGTQFTKLRADVSSKAIQRLKVEYPSQWKKMLGEWAGQVYQRRLISAAEKAAFEEQAK